MNTIKNNPFNAIVKEYDQWFDDNKTTFLCELEAVKYFFPQNGIGVEIGIGTGRFALELGIKYGVEPSQAMAKYAKQKGLHVKISNAENMEYENNTFDFAVMVAVDPFVNDIDQVYREIYRILKPNGKLIVGTLHKDGEVGKKYMSMTDSEVYKNANFHTVNETIEQMTHAGFTAFNTCQSLFVIHPTEIEKPIAGFDKGSFVAIEASK